MKNNFIYKTEKDFESIKHTNENGVEFWYARELMTTLEYSKWENFIKVINKAKQSCENSSISVFEHFPDVRKTSKMPNGAEKIIGDIKLTRYACYLIAQNGDSRKKAMPENLPTPNKSAKQIEKEKNKILDYNSQFRNKKLK